MEMEGDPLTHQEDIDPVNFPLPETPRREHSERRGRDQSCEPSGHGMQRNDAQRRADRERSPRESMRAHSPRRERPRESHTPVTPRVEKRLSVIKKSSPRTHPKKGRG